jgi:predicted nucleic-acid-binding protein
VIRSVLRAYRAGAGFADALIAALNAHEGRANTATFDKAARKKLPHFTDIPA